MLKGSKKGSIEGSSFEQPGKLVTKISRSKIESKGNKINNNERFLLFTLLGSMYALLNSSVIQILQNITITPIANNVLSFIGSTTFRGEIVPVIDLQSFFYGGQSIATTKTQNEQKNFVVVRQLGKTVFFQVESVLGSSVQPEESLIQDLIQPSNLKENPYFNKAFLTEDEHIFVQLNLEEILKRVVYEQEQSYVHFLNENKALLKTKEISSLPEEFNIELQQKLSSQIIKTADRAIVRAIRSTREVKQSATLVSIHDIHILIPNDQIVEIFNAVDITEVPDAPRAVLGVVNFRGEILNVLDLAEILIHNPTGAQKNHIPLARSPEFLILEKADQRIALFVDAIHEIIEINEEDQWPAILADTEVDSKYFFKGVVLDQSGHILLILNVDQLFHIFTNRDPLEKENTQIILFSAPNQEPTSRRNNSSQVSLQERDLLIFSLLGNKYALMNSNVIQILQDINITSIANCTPYFTDSTTFRGEIVPVIDIQSFLYGKKHLLTPALSNKHKRFIALEYEGKKAFFQVESVLGSINEPNESFGLNFVHRTDLLEKNYYSKVFLDKEEQIVVQLELKEIFEQITHEVVELHKEFLAENQEGLTPVELTIPIDEFNVNLHQKLSRPASIAGLNIEKSIVLRKKDKRTGIIVSVKNLDILIPNKHVREIFNALDITTAPNSSKAIVGAINFRGDVLGVLDLAEVLSLSSTDTKLNSNSLITNTEVLILETEQQQIALVVDEIREVDIVNTQDIRFIQVPTNKQNSEYFFTGVKLGQLGQIIPILNVEYLFQAVANPALLEQNNNQIVSFDNPTADSLLQIGGSTREGVLFEDEGYIFFLESENIVQVIDQHSFLLKDFAHDAIKGAAIHTNIVPIIDFNIILGGTEKNVINSQKTVGILVYEPKSNSEYVFLVDKVLNRVPSDKFEAYQTDLRLSAKALSPIISGFFSYQNTLGLTISPVDLLKTTVDIVKRNLKLKNIRKEFSSTLLPDEIEFLEGIRAKRQELELMLFYRHEGIRLDYFVFKLRKYALSIDVSCVKRVFASLNWQNVDSKHHPIIGIASINDDLFPVIDLAALILSSENEVLNRNNNFFILLKYQNHSFLVPVVDVEGVITIFKEETIPCEDVGMFLEGKKACRKLFSNEKEQLIYIIENKLLNKLLNNINFDIFLKVIGNNMNEKED